MIFAPHILQRKVPVPMQETNWAGRCLVQVKRNGRTFVCAVAMIIQPKSLHQRTEQSIDPVFILYAKGAPPSRLVMKYAARLAKI